ncbi:Uncharacterised protein [Yersinia aldovae]|uniref:hypothetical protein n=1 Tax=Yersinia aldovae TaxID=29483 RepID=UPI0005E2D57C|nr:hypothetical protein [Yersinia aldovae]CNG96547.1 Uncharacterised protein [Yersinia aldovae]
MKKIKKNVLFIIIAMSISVLPWGLFYAFQNNNNNFNGLTCTANVNLSLSDGFSEAPAFHGVIAISLNQNNDDGFIELSGLVKWKGSQYPVSKLVTVKYNKNEGSDYTSISTKSSVSLEHDQSPTNLIETFMIGSTSQPLRIFKFNKIFNNAYLISNINSPITVCVEKI